MHTPSSLPESCGPSRQDSGFTLVELLIMIAMIGLITAIALPNYTEFMRRSWRADAQLVLQQAANHLERGYAECNSYTQRDATTATPCITATPDLPAALKRSPTEGTQRYTISIVDRTRNDYRLEAVPADASDRCGTFRLLSTGVREHTGTASAEECWRR